MKALALFFDVKGAGFQAAQPTVDIALFLIDESFGEPSDGGLRAAAGRRHAG